MTRRVPLTPMRDDDPRRLEMLAAKGLDADMNPLDASPLEREANRIIKENPMPEVVAPAPAPLISGKLAAVAGFIATALAGAAVVLPQPFQFVALALAGIAAFLAGQALPSFSWAEGKPLVPVTLVPMLLTAATAAAGFASMLSPGSIQSGLMLAAAILSGLAGKAAPQPVKS